MYKYYVKHSLALMTEVYVLSTLNNGFHPLLWDLRLPVVSIQAVLLLLDIGASKRSDSRDTGAQPHEHSQLRPYKSTNNPKLHRRHDYILYPLQKIVRVFGRGISPVGFLFLIFARSDVDTAEFCA